MSDNQHEHHGEHHGDHGQHQEHHNENHNAHEAPAPEPAQEVAPEPEAAPETGQKKRKATPARRAAKSGGELTWAEVEAIVAFSKKFDSASELNKTKTLATFGLHGTATAIELAQALRPSGGKIWAYETFARLARKVLTGQLGFLDGLAIIEEFTNSSPDEIKLFDNVASAFGSEAEYKKNMSIGDYVQQVLGGIKPDRVDVTTFDFIDGLLAVWPGEYA